jgi:RNA recognition motif-containing protein
LIKVIDDASCQNLSTSTFNNHIQISIISDSRGFAFVTYDKPEEAEEAIREMHKTKFEGR